MTATALEGAYRPAPPTPAETQKIGQVLEVLAGVCTEHQVLAVLRRHGGNVERTVQALLDDPNSVMDPAPTASDFQSLASLGDDDIQMRSDAQPPRSPPPSRPEKPDVHTIDLTGDDESEDLKRAMAMSLEESGPAFGPSTRPPDPNWAMVPSNTAVTAVTGISQDEQDMNKAIEASLSEGLSADVAAKKPLEEQIRKGETPVALRVSNPRLIYAAMMLHALYSVPQVRKAICSYFPVQESQDDEDVMAGTDHSAVPPDSEPGRNVRSLLETFVYLEYSRLSELNADQLLKDLEAPEWTTPNEGPGDLAFTFYEKLALGVESALHHVVATDPVQHVNWQRLFFFRHGTSSVEPYRGPFHLNWDISIAKITAYGFADCNDLVSCLAKELRDVAEDPASPALIVHTSDVVAFQVIRVSSDRAHFNFPPHFYLDRFLYDKASLSNEKRQRQHDLLEEVALLEKRKAALTSYEGRDALADLRSAIYYYENIAEDDGDEMRKGTIQDTAITLRKIIGQLEAKIADIESSVKQYKEEAEQVFECAELQEHKYELRAVLMHDGFYGRNHLHSYTKHKGTWWKTTENSVFEVPEIEVLEDPAGLHLGAGPFLLIYSRSVSPEEESEKLPWPERIKDLVKLNNKTLFEELSPEVLLNVEDPNSPMSIPQDMPIDTPTDSSSMVVEPPSRADPMELDN
ncbi:hypothetical protein PsYK624_149270 [Phanerochaete sordida]|uniref:USP domain-containing protein n=1 Tax=Phanerochaete sordida TaxID=48140 RepID=A0A9P3GNJ2_9APHY|nr:hypothetical protein PsYK624_149270 [Phanerochaete sordida]